MKTNEKNRGMFLVIASYVMWGCLPIFWKTLEEVSSFYVLCSRIVWSLVFSIVYLTLRKKWASIHEIFKNRNVVLRCILAGVLVCINWGGYIWAVNNGHILDSCFGYYLYPILVVFLSIFFFHERLSVREWIAVAFAVMGVFYMIIRMGHIPFLSLGIGGSFALYGMVKKKLPIKSDESLFLETLFLFPAALIYIIYGEMHGIGAIGILQGGQWILLPLAGVATAIPLLVYAAGVQKIPFYLTGILMYLNPTIQFLIGIFLFKEKMDVDRIISFTFIWVGVIVMMTKKSRK